MKIIEDIITVAIIAALLGPVLGGGASIHSAG